MDTLSNCVYLKQSLEDTGIASNLNTLNYIVKQEPHWLFNKLGFMFRNCVGKYIPLLNIVHI